MLNRMVTLAIALPVYLSLTGCPCDCEGTPDSLVKGTITDSATGQPLAGVTVATESNGFVLSDTEGKYQVRLAANLTALKQGYALHSASLSHLAANTTSTYNFALTPGDSADNTAPPVPVSDAINTPSFEKSLLRWKLPIAVPDLAGYAIYRGGKPLQLTAAPQIDTAPLTDAADCYTLAALDASGNESPRGAEMCRVLTDCPTAVTYRIIPDLKLTASTEITITQTVPDQFKNVSHNLYRDGTVLTSAVAGDDLTIHYSDTSVAANSKYCYSMTLASDGVPGCDQLCISTGP